VSHAPADGLRSPKVSFPHSLTSSFENVLERLAWVA
jgi:hypothetical protein